MTPGGMAGWMRSLEDAIKYENVGSWINKHIFYALNSYK